jgi:hypothetical protein
MTSYSEYVKCPIVVETQKFNVETLPIDKCKITVVNYHALVIYGHVIFLIGG